MSMTIARGLPWEPVKIPFALAHVMTTGIRPALPTLVMIRAMVVLLALNMHPCTGRRGERRKITAPDVKRRGSLSRGRSGAYSLLAICLATLIKVSPAEASRVQTWI